MDLQALSHRVVEQRKKLGLSQHALAQRAGISRNYISLIERGEADNVSPKKLSRLATALGVTTSELIGEDDKGGSYIPPTLREFGVKAGLSFDVVDRLVRIPRPGQEPETIEGWEKLYDAVRPYLEERTV